MQPDIVFVITDQQRYDTVRAFGYPHIDTPNLDRLANEGTWFSRCYVTGASCVPSRASLFNGLYPHTLGVLDNAASWRHTWVEQLAAAGYRCASIGKMHTQPMDAPAGFDTRTVVENKDRSMARRGRDFVDAWDRALAAAGEVKPGLPTYRLLPDYRDRLGAYDWTLPEALHSDTFVGRAAVDWVERNAANPGPFFLQVGFPGPHPPYDPPRRWSQPYLDRALPIRPLRDADLDSQPPPFAALRQKHVDGDHDAVPHVVRASAAARHRQRAHYLGNVSLIDHEVGRILAALEAAGRLDSTIVVVTSDHGDCLGDHGHSQKWTMYEEAVRVPLIVWSPQVLAARGEVDALVQLFDIAPTLLVLAGLEPPSWWEAVSLAPALRGESFAGRRTVYCEQGRDVVFQFADFVTMLRTQQWKLVHFLGEDFGQLFDLADDPDEERNRWADASCRAIRDELVAAMHDWRMRSAYETRAWTDAFR